jgi:ribosomal protein S18 acetylase RimI-like enzyme
LEKCTIIGNRNISEEASMPRLKPAPGYVTAKEATQKLNISDGTLSSYVKKGWLNRYGPPERKQKFYKLSEVEAILLSRNTFDEYQVKSPSFFRQASFEDVASIVDIDERTFNIALPEPEPREPEPRESYMRWLGEIYLRWMSRNPEAFHVLRNENGKVVGFSILLPMKKDTMDRFVRDEIKMSDIPSEDIDLFEPGKVLHVYVIAICIDPSFRVAIKQQYAAKLLLNLFGMMMDFAERGVEIETITARSYKPDGQKLMQRMGMPQLRSPVRGKQLFSVRIADSGNQNFVAYSDKLGEWKRSHQRKE